MTTRIETLNIGVMPIIDFLFEAKLVKSKSEANRLLRDGAVYSRGFDGGPKSKERLSRDDLVCHDETIQVGKRRFGTAQFPDAPTIIVEVADFTNGTRTEEEKWLKDCGLPEATIQEMLIEDWGE